MPDDQDELFTRLVQHFESLGRLGEPLPLPQTPQDARQTRRILIRDGNGAIGRLEVSWIPLPFPDPALKRRLTWTSNVNAALGPSTVTELSNWDEALAVIDGLQLSP